MAMKKNKNTRSAQQRHIKAVTNPKTPEEWQEALECKDSLIRKLMDNIILERVAEQLYVDNLAHYWDMILLQDKNQRAQVYMDQLAMVNWYKSGCSLLQ